MLYIFNNGNNVYNGNVVNGNVYAFVADSYVG